MFLFLADSVENQVYFGGDFLNLSLDGLLIVLKFLHPIEDVSGFVFSDPGLSLLHDNRFSRVDDFFSHGLNCKAGA